MLQEKDALVVHWAMHAGDDQAVLSDGTVVAIERAKNGCSSCRVAGYNFMEQNKTKTSKWARMARQGRKITWIITSPRWGRIMDDKIVQQPYPALLKSEQPSTSASSASNTATVTTTTATVATSTTQTSTQQATKEVSSKLKRNHEDLFDSKKDETIELKKQKLETRTYTLEVGFPQHWSTPFNKVQQVELFRGDDEYEKISHLMQSTISDLHKSRYGYRSFAVRKIFRLQHPSLWGHYYLRKQEVIRCNDAKPEDIVGVKTGNPIDPAANEYHLFHGLNHKIVDKICESGFDERVSNLAGMFGCGIYFAEDSSKSSQYSHTATCAQGTNRDPSPSRFKTSSA
ncbi:Poly [ADP-ribose] polymerase [Balamuthia mandrillaris]